MPTENLLQGVDCLVVGMKVSTGVGGRPSSKGASARLTEESHRYLTTEELRDAATAAEREKLEHAWAELGVLDLNAETQIKVQWIPFLPHDNVSRRSVRLPSKSPSAGAEDMPGRGLCVRFAH